MVRHRAGETITVTRPGAPTDVLDAQGNPVLAADTTFTIEDVAIAPTESDETAGSPGVIVVTGFALYCPHDTPALFSDDRITIRGVAGWQVTGDSSAAGWRSPFDGLGRGVVIHVKRAA